MELNLKGRSVLVTGGSKGIGAAVGRWFAQEGCEVHLAARTKAALDETAQAIRQRHQVAVHTHAHDLGDAGARADLTRELPDVDILVNNAGAIPGGSIEAVSDEAWRTGWELKVFGFIDLTRHYLAKMKAKKKGVIINVIGAAGSKMHWGYAAGSMGNAALIAFTNTMGGHSPEFGVRVLGVSPGPVETDRIAYLQKQRAKEQWGDESRYREMYKEMAFGRPASPDEIAAAVVFFASDLSGYTSGTVVTIDGGSVNRS